MASFALLVISFLFFSTLLFDEINIASCHGRMMEPPSRNTMWRFGFATKANYEDSQLFCGGLKVQWEDNHGKCGVCGDPYNGEREHETGGFYARNITVRTYAPSSPIDVLIDIVANHGGSFKFQMCWRNDSLIRESEECFENLQLTDGRYAYPMNSSEPPKTRLIQLQLPHGRVCSKCILRWHWMSGNNWGTCPNGSQQVGCGPQETYRNCADIAVSHDVGIRGPSEIGNESAKRWMVHRSLL